MGSQYHADTGPKVPSYYFPEPVTAGADARNGFLKQVQVTLYSANTAYEVVLPNAIRGFSLYPSTADTYFAIGENPVAMGTITNNVVAANFTVGATAPFSVTTVRVLDDATANANASLRLFCPTANAVVRVGVF